MRLGDENHPLDTVAHIGQCGGNFHLLPLFSRLFVQHGARLGLVSRCASASAFCVHLSVFNPRHVPEKASCPGSFWTCPVPIPDSRGPSLSEKFPTLPLHPGSPSPDVPSPQLVWSHKPKRAWGCPSLCSLFHTLCGKLQDKWSTEAFHLSQPGMPQVSLMNALTIWSSVFSIRLQEVFLAPSLPCLPSLRLHLVLCSPYFWCYFFVFFMVPTALDLKSSSDSLTLSNKMIHF